ncbi:MAG: undecaprenyl diphosphate synthase family protein [Candidatus Syntropharchaeales archaeon]
MLKSLLQRVYEPYLKRATAGAEIDHILLVLTANDIKDQEGILKLKQFIEWSFNLSIHSVAIYISMNNDNSVGVRASEIGEKIFEELGSIDGGLSIYSHESYRLNDSKGNKPYNVEISIGLGGRDELVYATRKIMEEVKAGHITPEEIDEKLIESKLIFNLTPDLIIRSGTTKLTDFLIWQAVYSELYFTDVSWVNFRKIDFLRAVRDFKKRERRFGR